MFILNKLMLLTPKNTVPQKCSVHKIITGFIRILIHGALQAVWSRAKRAGASLLLPSCHMPPRLGTGG